MRKLLAFLVCALILGATIGCEEVKPTEKGTIGSGGQPLPPPAPPAPPVPSN